MITGTLLGFFRSEAPTNITQRTLTFAERVAYQRAIEDVYWRHRIWPRSRGERHDPKPSLDAVMSQAQLEEKVHDYLRKSQALEDYWYRPINAEQLQAEMDRMAQHTKQPEVLRELFKALGDDPFVIAECLARPMLAERLLTNWNAFDERIHGDLRKRAEGELQAHPTVEQMRFTSGTYSETEFVRSDSTKVNRGAGHAIELNSRNWNKTIQTLAETFGIRRQDAVQQFQTLPMGTLSPIREDETRYYAIAVIERTDDRIKLATVAWPKQSLESWLVRAGKEWPATMTLPSAAYTLPTISDAGECTDDTWTPTPGPPDGRLGHTAVWTGTEMIIWGGTNYNTGGRYNPATDTWIATSPNNAPSARSGHTAVWTGSEMIVWGGTNDSSGGRYNPATNTWTATSTINAPSARSNHTAVWTGSELIVWGGYGNGGVFNTGGRYNPAANTWTATNTTNAPSARSAHSAVWTGSQMIGMGWR